MTKKHLQEHHLNLKYAEDDPNIDHIDFDALKKAIHEMSILTGTNQKTEKAPLEGVNGGCTNTNPKLDFTLMPEEFNDVVKVLMDGAKKYDANGWLKGVKFSKETNIASIRRHVSEYRLGGMKDKESGLHPLLHAACRCLMQYTVDQRQIQEFAEMKKIQREFRPQDDYPFKYKGKS